MNVVAITGFENENEFVERLYSVLDIYTRQCGVSAVCKKRLVDST